MVLPIDHLRQWCGRFYHQRIATLWKKYQKISLSLLHKPERITRAVEACLPSTLPRPHILAKKTFSKVPFAGQRLIWNATKRGMATVTSALNALPSAFSAMADRQFGKAQEADASLDPSHQVIINLSAPTLDLTDDVRGSLGAYQVAIDQWVRKTNSLVTALESLGLDIRTRDDACMSIVGGTFTLAKAINMAGISGLSAVYAPSPAEEPIALTADRQSLYSASSVSELSLIFPHLREAELDAFSDISSIHL